MAFKISPGIFLSSYGKLTEEIGVGRAFGTKWGMNCTFIVARYKPKGNIDSEFAFKENVERGTFDAATYNCSAVVDCSSVAAAETQVRDSRVNNQQDSEISHQSRTFHIKMKHHRSKSLRDII
ncbi:hypothetical protein OS493_005262 [Desmophyllum pertusum]|uniref:Uncharacterized protein n=1 Tax=Desmophyllum pertusum TaxID=174260 RepID=A0A9W9Z7M4_9CNID|nr:hypothetical protein OS493_005262 [Desmophyllum pertusum]